jgi:hypothetical protein
MRQPRNIVRIDTYNTHGWQVRITRHRNRHTKFFSDTLHGGSDGALQAAEKYRDDKLASMPPPLPGTKLAAQARSTSGVAGIRLNVEGHLARVEADAVLTGGKREVRTFSIKKWGLRKALWKACLWKARSGGEEVGPQAVSLMYEQCYPRVRKQLMDSSAWQVLADDEMEAV